MKRLIQIFLESRTLRGMIKNKTAESKIIELTKLKFSSK